MLDMFRPSDDEHTFHEWPGPLGTLILTRADRAIGQKHDQQDYDVPSKYSSTHQFIGNNQKQVYATTTIPSHS